MTNETPQPIFEMPDGAKYVIMGNPRFRRPWKLSTRPTSASGETASRNILSRFCFWLGQRFRQDFLEVSSAINGYGAGATKILRSLYERAVTIEYLVQNPNKVDRFLQFAAIQENRAVEAALKQIPQDQVDAEMRPENTVAETRKRYEQYKGNFKATACRRAE